MKYSFILFIFLPFLGKSQLFYNTDDYFSISNPSAFAEKRIYTTGVFNFNNLNAPRNNYSYAVYKQNIGGISVGVNCDFQNFGLLKSTRGALQVAYPWRLTRKLTLNLGIGVNATKDNFFYSSSGYPMKFKEWNPAYIGIDAGISLFSRKWNVGFSIMNLNQGKRVIDTVQSKTVSYFNFFGSYDFKLDSLSKFHLVPSLFIQYSPNGFYSYYFNLKFDFFSHAIGLGYSQSNPSLFYQYRFKKGITIGASIGKYFSPFYLANNSWNGMLRVNYQLNKRRTSGTIFL